MIFSKEERTAKLLHQKLAEPGTEHLEKTLTCVEGVFIRKVEEIGQPSDLIQQAVVKDEFLDEEIISHKDQEFIYNPEDVTHYPTYETEDVPISHSGERRENIEHQNTMNVMQTSR